VLISWGEQTVDSSVASVLNSSIPLFTLPIAHFMLADERISARKLVGLLIGFSGVLVLISRDLRLEGLTENMVGQLAILLATLLYAFSGVFVRRNLGGVSPLVQTMAPLVVADGAIWIGVLTVESPLRLPALPITWLAIVWLGLLGTCLAYLMFYNLLHSIGATRTSMVTYLIAVVGVIIGIVFLNEPLDWRLALGALLVICGIWVVNHRRRQPSPLPAAD
jgi:drug/metabolite transporter (DMT)-like permease